MGDDSRILYDYYDLKSPSLVEKLNVVFEDRHLEINVGQEALGYLKSKLKNEIIQIDNDILETKILSSWKYFDDFCINCKNYKLFLLEGDFSKPAQILNKIRQRFDVKIDENSFAGCYGLTIFTKQNECLIIIDSSAYKDDRKIQHEFTRYVQKLLEEIF